MMHYYRESMFAEYVNHVGTYFVLSQLTAGGLAPLSDDFDAQLMLMEFEFPRFNDSSFQAYMDLLQTYGSFVITHAQMGGSSTM